MVHILYYIVCVTDYIYYIIHLYIVGVLDMGWPALIDTYIERGGGERERYTSRYIRYGARCGPPPTFLQQNRSSWELEAWPIKRPRSHKNSRSFSRLALFRHLQQLGANSTHFFISWPGPNGSDAMLFFMLGQRAQWAQGPMGPTGPAWARSRAPKKIIICLARAPRLVPRKQRRGPGPSPSTTRRPLRN